MEDSAEPSGILRRSWQRPGGTFGTPSLTSRRPAGAHTVPSANWMISARGGRGRGGGPIAHATGVVMTETGAIIATVEMTMQMIAGPGAMTLAT